MLQFTALETAALHAIFDETPEIAGLLREQLEVAYVLKRENTGGGFLTTIAVPVGTPKANCHSVLGYETHASIEGMAAGLGFALFMDQGWLHLLDGWARGGDNTTAFDFTRLPFSIFKTPMSDC